MSAIPPNNLEQLVAWIRLFAEDVQTKVSSLKQDFQELKKSLTKE